MQSRVGVIVGSLRKAAYTRMLARALPELTPPSLQLVDIGIGDLPLYNYDLETDQPPPAWTAFRAAVKATDALLFVTPEFNRGIPGALKNAMDVGSRPWGDSAWSGTKPWKSRVAVQAPRTARLVAARTRRRTAIKNSGTSG